MTRDNNAGSGWVSYLEKGEFYTNFSIISDQFYYVPVNISLTFLFICFVRHVLCSTWMYVESFDAIALASVVVFVLVSRTVGWANSAQVIPAPFDALGELPRAFHINLRQKWDVAFVFPAHGARASMLRVSKMGCIAWNTLKMVWSTSAASHAHMTLAPDDRPSMRRAPRRGRTARNTLWREWSTSSASVAHTLPATSSLSSIIGVARSRCTASSMPGTAW